MNAINRIGNNSMQFDAGNMAARNEPQNRTNFTSVRAFSTEHTHNAGDDMQSGSARAAWRPYHPAAMDNGMLRQQQNTTEQTGGADPSQGGGLIGNIVNAIASAVLQIAPQITSLIAPLLGTTGAPGGGAA